LTPAEREKFFLDPTPPAWCSKMAKWPYQAQSRIGNTNQLSVLKGGYLAGYQSVRSDSDYYGVVPVEPSPDWAPDWRDR
jgi:hypothetical protein